MGASEPLLGAKDYVISQLDIHSIEYWGHVLVGKPSKATEYEQMPIVSAHANILDSLVDKSTLYFVYNGTSVT